MNDKLTTNVPNEADKPAFLVGAVIGSSIQEKYDELCKEITRLQEKYDENGYDCSPMIKLQRIEATVDSVIKHYAENCR